MQNAMAEFVLKGFSYTYMRYLGIILEIKTWTAKNAQVV